MIAVIAVACVPPPPTFVVEPELPSTRESNWLERATSLRTSLGRAGIALEMRGARTQLESSDCAVGKRRCIRCALIGERDRVSDTALAELVAAFMRYPVEFLDAAKIARVALCKDLNNHSSVEPGGIADPKDRVLYVNLKGLVAGGRGGYSVEEVAQIGHHEIYHLFDLPEVFPRDDFEWEQLNPRGFVYGRHRGETRPFGFVNAYAATNAVEDRASTFEYLMARGEELCALARIDPKVAGKARLVWRRVAAVANIGFVGAGVSCAAELQ